MFVDVVNAGMSSDKILEGKREDGDIHCKERNRCPSVRGTTLMDDHSARNFIGGSWITDHRLRASSVEAMDEMGQDGVVHGLVLVEITPLKRQTAATASRPPGGMPEASRPQEGKERGRRDLGRPPNHPKQRKATHRPDSEPAQDKEDEGETNQELLQSLPWLHDCSKKALRAAPPSTTTPPQEFEYMP
eukprot:Gb_06037 [translate_table: standard]